MIIISLQLVLELLGSIGSLLVNPFAMEGEGWGWVILGVGLSAYSVTLLEGQPFSFLGHIYYLRDRVTLGQGFL